MFYREIRSKKGGCGELVESSSHPPFLNGYFQPLMIRAINSRGIVPVDSIPWLPIGKLFCFGFYKDAGSSLVFTILSHMSLGRPKLVVAVFSCYELSVGAVLSEFFIADDEDFIAAADGAESMCDTENGYILHGGDRIPYYLFADGIQIARGFV